MIRKIYLLELILCICVVSCTNSSIEQPEGVRVVSLSPGITATVVDIGFSEFVVGRSSFCVAVDKNIPVVGDLAQVDYERLLRLAPTDVLVQSTSSGIDPHLKELAAAGHFSLHSWRVDRLSDIKLLYQDLSKLLGGRTIKLKLPIEVQQEQRKTSVLMMTLGSDGGTGLCFGRETYLGDILELMGGNNALKSDGWVKLSLEDIGELHPDLIIIVSDSMVPDSSLIAIRSLRIPITSFVHTDALIPSSKIVDVADALQQMVRME